MNKLQRGLNLRNARINKKLLLEDVAEKTGLRVTRISKLENGAEISGHELRWFDKCRIIICKIIKLSEKLNHINYIKPY